MTARPGWLEKILARSGRAFDPVLVVLSGFYTGGQPTREGDIGLRVVTRKGPGLRERQLQRLGLYRPTHIPVQMITISQQRFEETRAVIGGLPDPAVKYGPGIYYRA